MASAFGHAFTAIALGTTLPRPIAPWKLYTLGAVAAILPDADVLAFTWGIPYDSLWGHRGFTHSLLFALFIGLLFTFLFYRNLPNLRVKLALIAYFSLCAASHGLLDAMTSGGRGVAFFSPWDQTRYFLPWRPIQVSPIGISNFFSEWGIRVIMSELLWIGIPGLLFILVTRLIKKKTYGRG